MIRATPLEAARLGFFRGGIVRLAGDGLLLIPSGFVGARERFRA
ncbi:hypothetical protein ACF06V_30860 [Streptomyces bobili]